MDKYDCLKLGNQLCFPLYAAGKEVVKKYHPLLDEFNLTYTQYITLMVLWETDGIPVKELGNRLLLDSGTLTPLLKSMEKKGFVIRRRGDTDERMVFVHLTDEGLALRDRMLHIPAQVGKCVSLSMDEVALLHSLLAKLLDGLSQD